MPLIDDINKIIDVTAFDVRATPGASRGEGPLLRPSGSGDSNVAGFKRAIAALLIPGLPSIPGEPSHVRPQYQGTLYVPPGRYLVELDPDVRDNWNVNFAQHIGPRVMTTPEVTRWKNERVANPFGASVYFPPGITLWLAPGAVLVPAAGCIVDISCSLICDDIECFETSALSLVVFGSAVPVIHPEWWGVFDRQDAAPSIQRAINAAIHDRYIAWPGSFHLDRFEARVPDYLVFSRSPLVVELRGRYTVSQTINVRADSTTNGVLDLHATRSGDTITQPSGAVGAYPLIATLIRGAWGGASREAATLIATEALDLNPILRIAAGGGLTVRNLTFVSVLEGYQPGVEVRPFSEDNTTSTQPVGTYQDMAFFSCCFEGPATPLAQIGMRVAPATDPRFDLPYSTFLYSGGDYTFLSFQDCDFRVSRGGIGVDVRASQAVPIRFRRCDFSGKASAMLSLWNATHYIEDCRFDNGQRPVDPPPLPPADRLRGFEGPDGSDLYLRQEYPRRDTRTGIPRYADEDNLPGLTAIGCVSLSHRFLSTVRPNPNESQQQDWPVVLVNVRQRAPGPLRSPSIRWGQPNILSGALVGDPTRRRMSRGSPLVVLGGSFSSEVMVLRGAVQAAVVGSRVHGSYRPGDGFGGSGGPPPAPGVMFDRQARGEGSDGHQVQANPFTVVFGLLEDQRLGGIDG